MITKVALTKKRSNFGYFAIVFPVAILVVASGIIFSNLAPSRADDFDACYMTQKFIKEQLDSPSTATFAPCRKPDTTVIATNNKWTSDERETRPLWGEWPRSTMPLLQCKSEMKQGGQSSLRVITNFSAADNPETYKEQGR